MPRDLVQLYPTGGAVLLRTTEDHSTTRLLLTMRELRTPLAQRLRAELDVGELQQLAGGILQWLAENRHELPEIDWPDDLIPWDEDEDEEPAVVVVPEHRR